MGEFVRRCGRVRLRFFLGTLGPTVPIKSNCPAHQPNLCNVTPPDVSGLEQEVRRKAERISVMITFMGSTQGFS